MSSEEIVPLALLDGYQVRWSRETVARDIVQNFFDEVEDFRQVTIAVDEEAGAIEVRGPSVFDFEYLRYLGGTSKQSPGRRSAGGFGEGLKICALVLLRDHHCALELGGGAWEARAVLRPMKLGRELCYALRPAGEGAAPGSHVRITGADRKLCAAFAGAKELFRHPENPRLASPIHVDEAAGIGVYEAKDPYAGDIFYRRQHRGQVRFSEGSGLTFCFDDRIPALEGDRDRRNLAAAAPMVAAIAGKLPDEALGKLIRHLRRYWSGGGRVLTAFVAEARRRGLKLTFPRRWLARTPKELILEERAERRGYHLGVEALGSIGMPSVAEKLGQMAAPRAPTPVEAARMAVIRAMYRRFVGRAPVHSGFQVVDLATRLYVWQRQRCLVPAEALAAPFGEGAAICLSALAIAGGLRARSNGDRLTALLDGVLTRQADVAAFAARWDAAERDPSGEAAAALEMLAQDEESTPKRVVWIAVLAPEGFTPLEAFTERVKRLGREEQAQINVIQHVVNGPVTAAAQYARGIPSVWVGDKEAEPEGAPRAPRFAPRSFAGPDGQQALWPGDAVLRALIREEGDAYERRMKTRRYPRGRGRYEKGHDALGRWLARHAPEEHRRFVIRVAVQAPIKDAMDRREPGTPWGIHDIAQTLAERALLARPGEAAPTAEEAAAAVAEGLARAEALLARLRAAAPGLSGEAGISAATLLLQRAVAQPLRRGATLEATEEAAAKAAPVFASLAEAGEATPLDTTCQGACRAEATQRFWEVLEAGGDVAAAEAEGRARLEAAVEFALARHEERDEEGDPLPCFGIHQALAKRLRPDAALAQAPSAAAAAVRSAWAAAIAEGCSELQAVERCLAAAQPFDDPSSWRK